MCILKDVNMMSLSDDTNNSHLAVDGGDVKSNLPFEGNDNQAFHNANGQAHLTPNGADKTVSEGSPSPAWLSKDHNPPGPSKVKLPPVTVPVNTKRKHKRITNKNLNKQGSRGKLSTAIEPLQEEA